MQAWLLKEDFYMNVNSQCKAWSSEGEENCTTVSVVIIKDFNVIKFIEMSMKAYETFIPIHRQPCFLSLRYWLKIPENSFLIEGTEQIDVSI